MNYRHIYHAGNFADVFKHIVLTRLIDYLKRKDKAFRVHDTHAGTGLYDLSSVAAQKTGEWRGGIGRLLEAAPTGEVAALLRSYLDVVREFAPVANAKMSYPGSPMIARKLLRKQDRLSLSELHKDDARSLSRLFEGDYQVRVNQLDGWLVAGAHLPPKEKRGLVLVDPPFEDGEDFARMIDTLAAGIKRWPSGTYCLWYPIKHERQVADFSRAVADLETADVMHVHLHVAPVIREGPLAACGLTIVNPPFVLQGELKKLMPFLVETLSDDPARRFVLRYAGD